VKTNKRRVEVPRGLINKEEKRKVQNLRGKNLYQEEKRRNQPPLFSHTDMGLGKTDHYSSRRGKGDVPAVLTRKREGRKEKGVQTLPERKRCRGSRRKKP